jgi:hypothetical protein
VNQSNVPLIFKLTAKNLRGVESSSQVPVTIGTAGAAGRAPIANAGPDLTVKENATVRLIGSRSQDPDRERLTFLWTQTAGPVRVFLNNSTSPIATFKAPPVPTNNSIFVFRLTVKDPAGLNSSDLARVIVQKGGIVDNRPVANAGRDQAAFGKNNVTLDGSRSADPDVRDKLTYQWRQIGGLPRVGLLNDNQPNATFVAPEVSANTTLTFALTVTDPARKNSTDTVKVVIMKPEGFPIWIIGAIAGAAAAGGVAAWYFLLRKPPKRRLTFVP